MITFKQFLADARLQYETGLTHTFKAAGQTFKVTVSGGEDAAKRLADKYAERKGIVKKSEWKRVGDREYVSEAYLVEGSKNPYQVRVETPGIATGDWMDISLNADSLEDIASAVGASPVDYKAHDKFGLHELVEFIEDNWIGPGPDGPGTSWDEIDMDVKSLKHDVLKISFTFSGVKMPRTVSKHTKKYGDEVKKRGVLTIMPGNA